jgi:hypothetical protein
LEAHGLNVIVPTSSEVAQSAEGFFDAVMEGTLRHAGDARLTAAVAGAGQRTLGEAWAWGRRQSTSDISPLVAASLARWGFLTRADELAPDDVYVG